MTAAASSLQVPEWEKGKWKDTWMDNPVIAVLQICDIILVHAEEHFSFFQYLISAL